MMSTRRGDGRSFMLAFGRMDWNETGGVGRMNWTGSWGVLVGSWGVFVGLFVSHELASLVFFFQQERLHRRSYSHSHSSLVFSILTDHRQSPQRRIIARHIVSPHIVPYTSYGLLWSAHRCLRQTPEVAGFSPASASPHCDLSRARAQA
jgi:hypothetical protein